MTHSQIKHIRGLSLQKYRKEHKAYLVEGDKNVKEWLAGDPGSILQLLALPEWLAENKAMLERYSGLEILAAADFEMEKITALKHPQKVLIVVAMKPENAADISNNSWFLYLEQIRDPGNMGTIIRTADWFGIRQILLSPDCVERYNPKVVQATMGSLLRADFSVMDFETLRIQKKKQKLPLYAACLEGRDVFKIKKPLPGIIAMGNESTGLSENILKLADEKITIPGSGGPESLNVGVATGIICAHFTLN
jgi:TrmH family RNA methyltransferase